MDGGIYDGIFTKTHWVGHLGQWQRCALPESGTVVFFTHTQPHKCTLLTWRSMCAAVTGLVGPSAEHVSQGIS
jgi:hypothetical protein